MQYLTATDVWHGHKTINGLHGQQYLHMAAGDSDDEGDLLAGMMSPPNGYSSADEALSYATPEQTASIQVKQQICQDMRR